MKIRKSHKIPATLISLIPISLKKIFICEDQTICFFCLVDKRINFRLLFPFHFFFYQMANKLLNLNEGNRFF